LKVNLLEQQARKNNIIISGVVETYAERTSEASDESNPPSLAREDTIATACAVFKDSCNVTVTTTDIATAFRLKSRRGGPRPLLVSFHSSITKAAVVRARRPKQTLKYKQNDIYINDHLTSFNSELSNKARRLVKDHEAFSSWIHNGQIFIKWSRDDLPSPINTLADLN
jgi:hypothetical protein